MTTPPPTTLDATDAPTTPSAQAMPHTLTQRLKAETQDLHDAAENHVFQRSLATGKLEPTALAAYLAQLRHIHARLDDLLQEHAAAHPSLAAAAERSTPHAPRIDRDLPVLGQTGILPRPLAPTAALLERLDTVARDRPIGLLGHHYVLEGSSNGNHFIAKVLAKRYGLTPGAPGLLYMDQHGDRQRPAWAAYKQAVDARPVTTDAAATVIAEARAMFEAVGAISVQLADLASDDA